MLNVHEAQHSPVIFGSVMKKGGNHHVFGNRETGVSSLTHHQGCNPKKMRHVRNAGSFAPLDVDDTRIVNGARKSTAQVESGGFIVVRATVFRCHNASILLFILSQTSLERNH